MHVFSPRARIHPVLLPPAPLPFRGVHNAQRARPRAEAPHSTTGLHTRSSLCGVWWLVRRTARHGHAHAHGHGGARDPPADGACARPDVGGCFTWCQDPPRPAHHARRARGGRAAPPRWRAGALRGVAPSGQCLAPVVVNAEATQRARVALLSACGLSVGYHGGWNAIIAFWSRPPDLCSCWRIRWPVGPRRPVRHGEVPGVLISILC